MGDCSHNAGESALASHPDRTTMRDLLPDARTTVRGLVILTVLLVMLGALAVQLHKLDVALAGFGQ